MIYHNDYFIVGNKNPTTWNVTIGADLIGYGICNTVIAVCDSVITFTRYKLLLSRKNDLMLNLMAGVYIFALLVCTSLPFYTIVPIFINVSDGVGLGALNICAQYIFAPAFALFNFYFSILFMKKIKDIQVEGIAGKSKLTELAKKSVVHSVIRSDYTF